MGSSVHLYSDVELIICSLCLGRRHLRRGDTVRPLLVDQLPLGRKVPEGVKDISGYKFFSTDVVGYF